MDTKIIEQIKSDLTKRREEVAAELASFTTQDPHAAATHTPKFTDLGDSSDDNAKEVDVYTTNLSLSKVLTSTLKDIDKALKNIAEGTYGVCVHCGKEIDEKRLLARPVSSACVACKSKLQEQS